MAVDILLLFGAKDGNVQPDPRFLGAGETPKYEKIRAIAHRNR